MRYADYIMTRRKGLVTERVQLTINTIVNKLEPMITEGAKEVKVEMRPEYVQDGMVVPVMDHFRSQGFEIDFDASTKTYTVRL